MESTANIRLVTVFDHGSSPLYFVPIIRTGSGPEERIKMGRYSENHSGDDDTWVAFKSKVVSRLHAEIWNNGMDWYIQDLKSSSGTFLNNLRLSPPSESSKPFQLKDGDVIQLGVDFRGGREEIFRCIKVRCQLNNSWLNTCTAFKGNMHLKIRELSGGIQADCAVCLIRIAPCQGLFVSPCGHIWHYKCIRPILITNYPQFTCPNCRSVLDLEEEIEDGEPPSTPSNADGPYMP